MPERSYAPLLYRSADDCLTEIASGDSVRIVPALLGAALESSDPSWVEACAVSLSLANDNGVRRASLLALGHLARRFGRLNTSALTVVLRRLESEEQLAAVVAELREDLSVYGVEY
jgi:hypothetical protein